MEEGGVFWSCKNLVHRFICYGAISTSWKEQLNDPILQFMHHIRIEALIQFLGNKFWVFSVVEKNINYVLCQEIVSENQQMVDRLLPHWSQINTFMLNMAWKVDFFFFLIVYDLIHISSIVSSFIKVECIGTRLEGQVKTYLIGQSHLSLQANFWKIP